MQTIPIQSIPSQSVRVVLSGQNVQIQINQKTQGIFVDVSANDISIVNGVIALDAVPLVCREYVGFIGNLFLIDTQGNSDPDYTRLGDRFQLIYMTADEYALVQ